MKATFSPYLNGIAPGIKKLIAMLRKHYDYVSVLSTDSRGFGISISQKSKNVSTETLTTERGNVVRVYRNGQYSEAAFNRFDPERPEDTCREILESLEKQRKLLENLQVRPYETGLLADEPETLLAEMETERLPEEEDMAGLIGKLTALSDLGMEKGKDLIDCSVRADSTHVSKMFLTEHRDLRQSYVYSDGSITVTGDNGERTEMAYDGISGRVGPELFDGFAPVLDRALEALKDLLRSERMEPGEYEIIASPGISGLIAHEAFGHGVEMDMFVKDRALGAEYIGKRVGSDLVTMHEGAKCGTTVASYAFDDEGTPAGDVTEIENGILKTGICDALSALRLGTEPTGNGKRENYAHKVYTRMTNTLFSAGQNTLEEMIASVSRGFLLRGVRSGMEDPKHWGIQCIVDRGYEIVDGKLTGRVVSPVVMTGYVPDLLGSVSMLGQETELDGSGFCGKGYKEWVKVAEGGPWIRAKARLG
ncbi:MAG: TldD/PmbA family protein [Clostridia bacterium]|nr:TldD/PmbA family protein [Clostridia bacterium]